MGRTQLFSDGDLRLVLETTRKGVAEDVAN